MAKKALGKGLGALIRGASSDTVPNAKVELRPGESVSQVPIADLVPSPPPAEETLRRRITR